MIHLVLLGLLLGGGGPEADLATITPIELRAHVGFLASLELEGRETGAPGGEVAASYLASQYLRFGLRPLGDGNGSPYLQRYPLSLARVDEEETRLVFEREGAEPLSLAFGEDFVPDFGASGDRKFEGRLLRTSWPLPEGEDASVLEGAVVLLKETRGAGGESGRGGGRRAPRFRAGEELGRAGAVAVLRVVEEEGPRGGGFEALADGARRERLVRGEVPDRPGLARLALSAKGRDRVEAWLGEGSEVPAAVSARGGVATVRRAAKASNVVGAVEGADPVLRDEVLVFSAHFDHEGKRPDGTIYPGADDNASGTSVLLEVAQALAASATPPRRTVVFAAFSGEEKGLLGSTHFADHPPVPIDRIVSNVNLDMVGRNDPATIRVTPSPEHPAWNTLASRVADLSPADGLRVEYGVDNYFHRSDQAVFARRDVPVVFLFADIHEDYHRPSDTPEKIDYDKLSRVARLAYRVVRAAADADERPRALSDKDEGR